MAQEIEGIPIELCQPRKKIYQGGGKASAAKASEELIV